MRRTTALLSAGALALAGALIAGPASADEGDLSLSATTVKAGESVTATLAGCEGFEFGGIALFAADADPDTDDPIVESDDAELNDDGELVGTLEVPATTEAGDYVVFAACSDTPLDEENVEAEFNVDSTDLKVEAAATPTPEPTTPTADPAKPVVKDPKYTG